MCAVAVSSLLGCDDGANEGANEATATSCVIEQFDSAWWNQSFPEQTGVFHVEFAADVTSPNMDAVIGLSNGVASRWANLAAIVRFNPQGYLDARDGGVYRADYAVAYQTATRYFFRFDVDITTHTYSVWYSPFEGYWYPLARNYAFRTEQASVARLNNVAAFVNPETSAHGSLAVCGFTATRDSTTADGCTATVAGTPFTNTPIRASQTVEVVTFRARAGVANMDGVIGVANGDVDNYNDYAASMRFWTSGYLEVRDGDAYRADRAVAYAPGEEFEVAMVIDLASHMYSVVVRSNSPERSEGYVWLATNYRFRTHQAGVTSLDRVATVVASATGRLDTCRVDGGPRYGVVAARYGTYDVLPLANGTALIADDNTTTRVDANNVPGASVAIGGKLAIDAAGSFYAAKIWNGQLSVTSFTPTFAMRWNVLYPIGDGDAAIDDVVVTSAGEVAVTIGSSNPWGRIVPVYIVRLGADGSYRAADALPAGTTAVALATNQYATARPYDGGYVLATHSYGDPSGFRTERYQPGTFNVTMLALAPDGALAISGQLFGTNDFGDGPISPYAPSPDSGVYWDQFLFVIDGGGATLFSDLMTNEVTGLEINGSRIAAAMITWTQLRYAELRVYDRAGGLLVRSTDNGVIGHFGITGDVALGPTGKTWLNVFTSFSNYIETDHPFLVTFAP